MKRAALALLSCLLLLLLTGCNSAAPGPSPDGETPPSSVETPSPEDPDSPADPDTPDAPREPVSLQGAGNTPGNLANDGIAAQGGDLLYHTDRMMSGSILQTPLGSDESTLFAKGSFSHLNVSGPFLFASSYEGIHRFRLDGSEEVVLKEDMVFTLTLQDEWLYYTDIFEGHLHRMRFDGTQETLLEEAVWDRFSIDGGHIYYATAAYDDGYTYVYRIPLAGGVREKVTGDAISRGFFILDQGMLYYSPHSATAQRTHQVDLATGEESLFLEKELYYMAFQGDTLYYFWNGRRQDRADQGLYRIRRDGGEDTLLLEDANLFSFNVLEDRIFFHTNDEARRLSMVDRDGTNRRFVEKFPD